MSTRAEVVRRYWGLFSETKFTEAKVLMHPDATVSQPNTREVFRGRDKFISVNEQYPGRWVIAVEELLLSAEETVITVVRVESIDQSQSFYATSFFRVEGMLIKEIIEYWSTNDEPPAWRIGARVHARYKLIMF